MTSLIRSAAAAFAPKRRTMNKLNKVAMLLASAALATAAGAQTVDNWKNGSNELVWKNGTNELCWRDANWTPATAAPGCDGALAAPVAAAPAPAAAPAAAPAPAPAPAPAVAASSKVTYAADAFFDFDKSVLKPAGKAKLDDLVSKVQGINLEVIIAVGHTDSIGSDAYNQKLSIRRAEAVKAYWWPRASKRTASTPKARARSSLWPTTRPKKVAPRTAAWKSKWWVPALPSNL